METRPVVDSDVLIDFLRGAGPGSDLLLALAPSLGYRVTAVSAFELALGRSYAADPGPVNALLSVPTLPLTREAGLRAGMLFARLRDRGGAIDIRDAMQAGICIEAGLPLVTRNRAHFERIEGLEAVAPDDWRRRATR